MARVNITVDDELYERAKERGVNFSKKASEAVRRALSTPRYWRWNTNGHQLPDGTDGTEAFRLGVVATFGPRTRFGDPLASLEPGDVVFAYTNEVGFHAVGRVTGFWDGKAVAPGEPRVSPDDWDEYHLPVRWLGVLPDERAINRKNANRVLNYNQDYTYRGTITPINRKEGAEMLKDIIIGRA
jgi:hypothetical protein